jgi:peptidoglycan hydrolase-like protein with peptidoglycan-binding domain
MKSLRKNARVAGMTVALALLLALIAPASSSAQVSGTFTSQMGIGSRGAQVTLLQQFLAQDPTLYPEGLVTGYYGSLTAKAVRNFQARYGISMVGRVGPITLARLNAVNTGGSTSFDNEAPTIFNVGVSTNAGGFATVGLATTENARSKVYYSTSPLAMSEAQSERTEPVISGQVSLNSNLLTTSTVSLSGLNTGSTYYYVVVAVDAAGNVSVTRPATFVAM